METDLIQPLSAKSPMTPNLPSKAAAKSAFQAPRPSALGRGLDALLPSTPTADSIRRIPVSQIDPNPHQPRRNFDPTRLNELAESIKLHGVIQPIVVRKQG